MLLAFFLEARHTGIWLGDSYLAFPSVSFFVCAYEVQLRFTLYNYRRCDLNRDLAGLPHKPMEIKKEFKRGTRMGTKVGSKWKQEPQSRTRIGTKWEQSGNKNLNQGQEWGQSANKNLKVGQQ